MCPANPIRIFTRPVSRGELAELLGPAPARMIKFVVDLDRKCIALGGELHSDAEALLLENGSEQSALWGGNYYPGTSEVECIQYTSMINIRPSQSNPSIVLQIPELRARMREIVHALVGRGEPLS